MKRALDLIRRNPVVAGFSVVVAVAAVISYDHIRLTAGDHWWAWLIPLSIDGLMVAGSTVLWTQRRAGQRGSVLAWAAVVLGLGMSLWANAAQADPGITALALSVWPALALAIGFELLVIASRPETTPEPKTTVTPKPVTAAAAAATTPATRTVSTPVRAVGSSIASRARAFAHAEFDAGRTPTAADIDAELGLTGSTRRCGSRELRKVLAERERTA